MNGDHTIMVEILNAIEHGTLSVSETRRRLEDIIDKEIVKTDTPANLQLVEECERLLWELNTNGELSYSSHLEENTIAAITRAKKILNKKRIYSFAVRASILAAAILLLAIGGDFLLRKTWITTESVNNEQQFIIEGQKFDPNLINQAFAGNDNTSASLSTTTYSDVIDFLSTNPGLDSSPLPEWIIDHYDCSRNAMFTAITVFYKPRTLNDANLMLNLITYNSFEEASMVYEQNETGHHEIILNNKVYFTENIDRTVATWLHGNTIITLSGNIIIEDIQHFIKTLYGVKYYE